MNTFIFSAEEINLMCIFDTSSKENLLYDLRKSSFRLSTLSFSSRVKSLLGLS